VGLQSGHGDADIVRDLLPGHPGGGHPDDALEAALRWRASELAADESFGASPEPLRRVCRQLEDLASQAEAVSTAVATCHGRQAARALVEGLVERVDECLEDETDALLDTNWVDVGVGDRAPVPREPLLRTPIRPSSGRPRTAIELSLRLNAGRSRGRWRT